MPQIKEKSLVFESDKIRFVNLPVIRRAIKYPAIVPKVFVIISFISVVLYVKIWDISISSVVINPVKAAFFKLRNGLHNIGKKKPNGINKSTFRHAFTKSDAISAKGIIFTAKSIFNDVTLGKPTSARSAVR